MSYEVIQNNESSKIPTKSSKTVAFVFIFLGELFNRKPRCSPKSDCKTSEAVKIYKIFHYR